MKMIGYIVSDPHKVMTALILVILFLVWPELRYCYMLEFSQQFNRYLVWDCVLCSSMCSECPLRKVMLWRLWSKQIKLCSMYWTRLQLAHLVQIRAFALWSLLFPSLHESYILAGISGTNYRVQI